MFKVQGGIYTNEQFLEIVPGTEENYGPFESYEQAYDIWSARTRANMDICCHRLEIKEC